MRATLRACRSVRRHLEIVTAIAVITGCTAQRVVVLEPPPAVSAPTDFGALDLVLQSFTVNTTDAVVSTTGTNTQANAARSRRINFLRQQFITYLRSRDRFGAVVDASHRGASRRTEVRLAVTINTTVHTHRTWALDVLGVATLGLWPIEPQWGQGRVSLIARLTDRLGNELWRAEIDTHTPYRLIFFAYYRTNAIEEALRSAYEHAFERCAKQLGAAHGQVVAALKAAAHGPRLAVLPPVLDAAARKAAPQVLDDVLLSAARDQSGDSVIGRSDLNALLDLQRQKDLAGCNDVDCMTEVAGALDVDAVLAVSISRLGNHWILTAKVLDPRHATVRGRSRLQVNGDATALLDSLPKLLGAAFSAGP